LRTDIRAFGPAMSPSTKANSARGRQAKLRDRRFGAPEDARGAETIGLKTDGACIDVNSYL
jgi:hypothetical protein